MRTDSNAFAFGATERSRSWWSDAMDPQVQAERKALQEEKQKLVAQMEEEQRVSELMKFTGPGLVAIIRAYDAQGLPADTEKVQAEFQEAFSGASFRQVLETLKGEGIVHELVSGPAGFMGSRSTRLYLLPGTAH